MADENDRRRDGDRSAAQVVVEQANEIVSLGKTNQMRKKSTREKNGRRSGCIMSD